MQSSNFVNWLKRAINWKPADGGTGERVITAGYVFVLLLAVLAAYMAVNHVASIFLFKADMLWMEEYLRDWIIKGVDMKTWNAPGAPNYFPEMLVYGIFRFLIGDIYWAYIGYGFVSIAFYVFAIYKILSFVTELSSTRRLWFALICISGMLYASILLGSQFSFVRMIDFWQSFTVAAHGGAIANSLIAILILLSWFRGSQKNPWWLAILFIHSILASLSDRLYLVWFSLPTWGAIFVLLLLRRFSWRHLIYLVALLSLSDFVGRRLFVWLVPMQIFPYEFNLASGFYSTLKFYSILFVEGWYHPFVLLSYACLAIFGVIIFYKTRISLGSQSLKINSTNEIAKLFLLFFAVFGLPVSFLAIILMNRPETQYFTGGNLLALSFWMFALVMTSFGVKLWARGAFHGILILILFGYAFFLAATSPMPLQSLLIPATPYSEIIACLDSHVNELGGENGIADFWQARKINLFSTKDIHIDQAMGGDLMVFQWASNREMYEDKKYTFVITDTPTNLTPILEKDVIDFFGKPDNRLSCDGFPVLVYKNGVQATVPLEIRIQNLLTGVDDEIILTHRTELLTDVGEWRGPTLYSTGEEGWLEFGPYITLPEGTYRVEWFGKLEYSELDEIGTVDVSSNQGSSIHIQNVVNRDTILLLADGRLAVLQFTLKRERPLVEFRFKVNDGVLLGINKVVVTLVR